MSEELADAGLATGRSEARPIAELRHVAARTAAAYAIVAGIWILVSDRALAWLWPAPNSVHVLQTYKGCAFVAVTAFLLYAALHAQLERWAEEAARRQRAEAALRQDIAERIRTETQLRAALADNVTLLREVHHRTKNNLQVLCDLLYLQLQALERPEEHRDLQDAYARVYVLARLHEQLYPAMAGGRIALGPYLGRLLETIRPDYPDRTVTLDTAGDGFDLDVDRALRVGLIANELVTNACRHGVRPDGPGTVRVLVRHAEDGDRVELEVADDGQGLPQGIDWACPTPVGLRIVRALCQGLKARVAVENHNGCRFCLAFPADAEAPVDSQ
jgi:two-component sensor histidine kinase